MRAAVVFLVLLTAVAGCDGSSPPPVSGDAGISGAMVRFALPESGAITWADVPFPSDLYLGPDHTVDLASLPGNPRQEPLYDAIGEVLDESFGFCATCNMYFHIDGALDSSTVPESAGPRDVAHRADPVVLVDADPASPDHGRLFPLRVQWTANNGLLAVRPVRGIALHQNRRYAIAITSALRGTDGTPLAPAPLFAALRDGTGPIAAPGMERARSNVMVALDELAHAGIDRTRVVAATSFTTRTVTADLVYVRTAVHSVPLPVATVDVVYPGPRGTLDDLLGIPAENRPGADVPPAEGVEGTRAFPHETTAFVVVGRFQAPRIVSGTGTELGTVRRDPSTNAITAGPLEDVPFLLIVPRTVDLTRLPVLVVHHGFAGNRTTGFVFSETAGHLGCAVLAIDGIQHGARAATARDEQNEMRGIPVPDGIAEHQSADVAARAFGFAGTPPDLVLFPGYPTGTFTQFAADVFATVRFVRAGDLSAIRGSVPELASLAFDPERVFYLGLSMGSVVGASVVVGEPDIQAAILNVPPGGLVENLSDAANFRTLTEALFLPTFGIRGDFDETTRAVVMDPVIDTFRWMTEPIDPLALAPYAFGDPIESGARPDVLYQIGSMDEIAAPPASESMLAAAGVPGVGRFDFAAIDAAMLPARENVMTPTGPVTAVVHQYDPETHGIATNLADASHYEPPLLPPFTQRPTEVRLTNEVAAVHAEIEAFLRSRLETGRATVGMP